jgi:hypothetical protein
MIFDGIPCKMAVSACFLTCLALMQGCATKIPVDVVRTVPVQVPGPVQAIPAELVAPCPVPVELVSVGQYLDYMQTCLAILKDQQSRLRALAR